MSFDLAFWKRSNRTRTAMLLETYKSICEGKDHPSMDFFDGAKVVSELTAKFGDVDSDDGFYSLDIGEGKYGNWVIINAFFSKAEEVSAGCEKIAISNNIMLFNPQRNIVTNNVAPTGLLESLPNISNATADLLRTVSIYTPHDLYITGSLKAFQLLCQHEQTVRSISLLYTLEAAIQGVNKTALSDATKADLQKEYQSIKMQLK